MTFALDLVSGAAVSYVLGAVTPDEVRKVLSAHFRLHTPERPWRPALIYLDTFDRQLSRNSEMLAAAREKPAAWQLWWQTPGTGAELRCTVEKLPAFAQDLPAEPLRLALESVATVRRLLPQVHVELDGQLLELRDAHDKTVLRLCAERGWVRPVKSTLALTATAPPSKPGQAALQPCLRLFPVRGYDEEFAAVRHLLATELGLAASSTGRSASALAAVGIAVDPEPELELQPDQPAQVAVGQIAGRLLASLCRHEEGTRRNLDSEFLHDFRVALRRMRSLLSQVVRDVFAPADVAALRSELEWLSQATGPTRDLDVYLLQLPSHGARLPAAVRADLAPLTDFLARAQQREQRRLARALRTPRYAQLIAIWQKFEYDAEAVRPAGSELVLRTGEVASRCLDRAWRRVRKRGRLIAEEAPPETLHALRIAAKKLRYLLEFFRSLYPPAEIAEVIKELKKLQDALGNFNDLNVQQRALECFAAQLWAEPRAPASTLLAMGRLIALLAADQDVVRQECIQRVAEFLRAKNHRRFRALWRAPAFGEAIIKSEKRRSRKRE